MGVFLWEVPLSRVLFSSTDSAPPYYPDYLYGIFSVTEADTGIRNPFVKVSVDINRNESVDFGIYFCLLNLTLEQLGHVSNISTLLDSEQGVGLFMFSMDPPTLDFPLQNTPCTYVWVLWMEAEPIPTTWTIDVSIVLIYSII